MYLMRRLPTTGSPVTASTLTCKASNGALVCGAYQHYHGFNDVWWYFKGPIDLYNQTTLSIHKDGNLIIILRCTFFYAVRLYIDGVLQDTYYSSSPTGTIGTLGAIKAIIAVTTGQLITMTTSSREDLPFSDIPFANRDTQAYYGQNTDFVGYVPA